MSVMRDCKDLNDYLARFQLACSLLHVREAISECIHDLMEELHQQGLQYAEVRFAPQKSCLHGLTQYEVTEIALQALKDSPKPCGLILSMMRGDDTHKANKETIEVAKAFYGKGVVAIDLAGAESLYPTHNFKEELALVREAGIPLIHGAICGWSAQAAVILPGDDLIDRIYPEGARLGSKTSLSFTPPFCAAMQAALCTRLLAGRPLESGRLYMADLLDMEMESIF